MISVELDALLKPQRFLPFLLWGVFLLSVMILTGVAFAVPNSALTPPDAEFLPLKFLPVAALVCAGLSFAPAALMLNDVRLLRVAKADFNPETFATDPQTGKVNADRLAKVKALAPHEQKLLGVAALYLPAFLLAVACSEAVAVFGLLGAQLSGRPETILPYSAGAALLLIAHFPKLDKYVDRAESISR